MADVSTQAKRSKVMSRNCGRGSESSEVELVAGDAEVFDDVGDDAARAVTRMPRIGDEAVRPERIRVVPVAAGGAFMHTPDFTQATIQLAAVPGRVFAHRSGSEDEFIAKGGGDGAARVEQCFQMGLGGLLKAERGFTPVASVGVTARQEWRFGDPHAVCILADLHFREWNDHYGLQQPGMLPA